MPNPQAEWLLRECLRTDRVGHSGRTLYDHLLGTYRLLRQWGAPDDVCFAGLFHSVYGTNAFKHCSMDAGNSNHRGALRAIIGQRAERLAYLFCTCDRPRALLDAYEQFRHTGAQMVIPGCLAEELKDLLEIEAANLLEQGLGETIASYRIGYRLAACAGITDRARTALLTRLGEVDRDREAKNERALEKVRKARLAKERRVEKRRLNQMRARPEAETGPEPEVSS